MGQDILTAEQRRVLEAVAAESQLADFYLSGGTALTTYYLQHRLSDDLDFFSWQVADGIYLRSFGEKLKTILRATTVRFEKLFERNQFFFLLPAGGELKVEFIKYPFTQLEPSALIAGLRVDSLRDIAANKLMAMLDRFDPKDFVDLYYIFQNADFQVTRTDAETKFGVKSGTLAKWNLGKWNLGKMTLPRSVVVKLTTYFWAASWSKHTELKLSRKCLSP